MEASSSTLDATIALRPRLRGRRREAVRAGPSNTGTPSPGARVCGPGRARVSGRGRESSDAAAARVDRARVTCAWKPRVTPAIRFPPTTAPRVGTRTTASAATASSSRRQRACAATSLFMGSAPPAAATATRSDGSECASSNVARASMHDNEPSAAADSRPPLPADAARSAAGRAVSRRSASARFRAPASSAAAARAKLRRKTGGGTGQVAEGGGGRMRIVGACTSVAPEAAECT